jgi:hypothetical protein
VRVSLLTVARRLASCQRGASGEEGKVLRPESLPCRIQCGQGHRDATTVGACVRGGMWIVKRGNTATFCLARADSGGRVGRSFPHELV